MRKESPWNRCDDCGRFIAFEDFRNGALREIIYPDSALTRETWYTLCKKHNNKKDFNEQVTR